MYDDRGNLDGCNLIPWRLPTKSITFQQATLKSWEKGLGMGLGGCHPLLILFTDPMQGHSHQSGIKVSI